MMQLSRRAFLSLGGLAAVTAVVGAGGAKICTEELETVSENVPVRGLPRPFDGYRVGILSDPHLGVFVAPELIERALAVLAQAHLDLIVLAGDFVGIPDSKVSKLFRTIDRFPKLQSVPQDEVAGFLYNLLAQMLDPVPASDGIVAILGNHDRWVVKPSDVMQLFRGKIRPLINALHSVERNGHYLDLIGVDDFWTGIPKLPPLPARAPGKAATILLSHNPDYVADVIDRRALALDLALCGHTHGGQIRLPLLGVINGYNIEHEELAGGLALYGNVPIYTSRGVGVIEIPYRINCPPEVNILTLTAV